MMARQNPTDLLFFGVLCTTIFRLYFIDPSTMAKVYRDMSSLSETGKQICDLRVLDIRMARQIAKDAVNIYDGCNPKFPPHHWNWNEVELETLVSKVHNCGKSKLGLSDEELQTLEERLKWAKSSGVERVSYNRFCLFIGEAVKERFLHVATNTANVCPIEDAADCYLA